MIHSVPDLPRPVCFLILMTSINGMKKTIRTEGRDPCATRLPVITRTVFLVFGLFELVLLVSLLVWELDLHWPGTAAMPVHFDEVVLAPVQSKPKLFLEVLILLLSFVFVPVPQVTEHCDHVLQLDY